MGKQKQLGRIWLAAIILILLVASFSCNRSNPNEGQTGNEATLSSLRTLAAGLATAGTPTTGGIGLQTPTTGGVGFPTET
mgnify:FL=1